MAIQKKILAYIGLLLVCFTVQIEACRTIYVHRHHRLLPQYCHEYYHECSGKDFLATVGTISLIAGSLYGLKVCFDYFYWTDQRVEQWERNKMAEIEHRNRSITDIKTDLNSHNSLLIERATEFGLNTKHSSLDYVLRAAAPLHSAVDSMSKDFKTLCTIIQGCGKRHAIGSRLVDDALAKARLLETIISVICQTREYKKEAVEIEKISNGRESIKLQEAALVQNMQHDVVVVEIEED